MQYLGVDFGLTRIGLSVSDGILASPWQVLKVKSFKDAQEKLGQLVSKERFDKIVIGVPEGKIGRLVGKFIQTLQKNGLNVEGADETLSTKEAQRQMIDAGIGKKKRQVNDAFSAAIILQNYLDKKS